MKRGWPKLRMNQPVTLSDGRPSGDWERSSIYPVIDGRVAELRGLTNNNRAVTRRSGTLLIVFSFNDYKSRLQVPRPVTLILGRKWRRERKSPENSPTILCFYVFFLQDLTVNMVFFYLHCCFIGLWLSWTFWKFKFFFMFGRCENNGGKKKCQIWYCSLWFGKEKTKIFENSVIY